MQDLFPSKKYKKAQIKEEIKQEFALCCAYCGCKSKQLTLDHVLAESKGGLKLRINLVPACTKCNLSKGSKLLAEWYTETLPFYCEKRRQKILQRTGGKRAKLSGYAKGFS